jgi:hypothetical protein
MTELTTGAIAPPPPAEHFQTVAMRADDLVVFLGSGANSDEAAEPWQEGCGRLPDDRDLARYIAARAELRDPPPELAQVAQRARAMHGETAVFEWLVDGLTMRDDATPSPVHELLAGLPGHFRSLGLEPRYQMIVTTKYDGALEKAFRDANEDFDVAVYVASRTGPAGAFVHVPWDGLPRIIDQPNQYPPTDKAELGFPIIAATRRLRRTVIVRFSRTVDDTMGPDWEDNCVITEDDYIDFLSGRPVGEVVPAQLLSKLKKANYLFLGYTIIPWRLRVFLHRVWGGSKLGGGKHWAVEPEPDQFEKDMWDDAGVTLFQESLAGYLRGLYGFIEGHVEELKR